MRWTPRATVAAVITDTLGRHLLVEEAPDGERVFNQPAGHLEPGESLVEAAIREVREETCRQFTPQALVGVYQWTSERDVTYLRFCFSGTVGEPLSDCRTDPEIIANHWLHPAVLESGERIPRSPMVLSCMRDAANAVAVPLEMLHVVP